nr:uncharacterized protein LOC120365089 [Saimiri boliviensis boliviensis]
MEIPSLNIILLTSWTRSRAPCISPRQLCHSSIARTLTPFGIWNALREVAAHGDWKWKRHSRSSQAPFKFYGYCEESRIPTENTSAWRKIMTKGLPEDQRKKICLKMSWSGSPQPDVLLATSVGCSVIAPSFQVVIYQMPPFFCITQAWSNIVTTRNVEKLPVPIKQREQPSVVQQ